MEAKLEFQSDYKKSNAAVKEAKEGRGEFNHYIPLVLPGSLMCCMYYFLCVFRLSAGVRQALQGRHTPEAHHT